MFLGTAAHLVKRTSRYAVQPKLKLLGVKHIKLTIMETHHTVLGRGPII